MNAVPKTSKMTRWRAASLIMVHVLFLCHFLHWKLTGRTLAPIEPSEAFDTLHLGILTVGFIFLVSVVLLTMVTGRFFCGWGCHILALQDLSAGILAKLRITTKPIRSRTLRWIPPLAAAYLLVWPQVQRLAIGAPLPTLRVVSQAGGWTSFTTTDLLRSFPGWGITVVTFIVCGFATVYFLGSRSFCRYACPYGAIFAISERIAPLRIIAGSGGCSDCGLCISSCKSNVQVITEIRQFGKVTDANCMKDLDCVSVCPTSALKYGLSRPALLPRTLGPTSASRQYDFSLREDLLMAGIVAFTVPVLRDLYDAVPFLLALAVSALTAYFAVIVGRMIRRGNVQLSNLSLRTGGRVTAAGKVFIIGAFLLISFILHSAFIRYHLATGDLAIARTVPASMIADVNYPENQDIDKATHKALVPNADYATALTHFQVANRWALVSTRSRKQQLAVCYMQTGAFSQSHNELNAMLASHPEDSESRILLAQSWLMDGRPAVARQQLETVIGASREFDDRNESQNMSPQTLALAYSLLGDIDARRGNHESALKYFELAVKFDNRNWSARLGCGAMLAALGRWDDAVEVLKIVVSANPDAAAAHNNLAAALVKVGHRTEALQHYQRAVELMPNNPLAYYNLGILFVELDQLQDAQRAFEQALHQEPNYAPALKGLTDVKQRLSAVR